MTTAKIQKVPATTRWPELTKKDVHRHAKRLAEVECMAKYGHWPRIILGCARDPGCKADAVYVRSMFRAYQKCAAAHRHPPTADLAVEKLFDQRVAAFPTRQVLDALHAAVYNWIRLEAQRTAA